MTNPAPSLAKVLPEAPEALVDVVDRALAFEQQDRWAKARAMQAAVQAAYLLLEPEEARRSRPVYERHSLTDSASPVTLMTPHGIVSKTFDTLGATAPPIRRRAWVVGGAGAALLVAIVVGQQLSRREPAPAPLKTTISAAQVPTSVEPTVIVSPPLSPFSRSAPQQPVVAPATEVQELPAADPNGRLEPPQKNKTATHLGEPKASASNSAAKAAGPATSASTTVAPAPVAPLPSADPLDRRR